jgi:hypothetical protein
LLNYGVKPDLTIEIMGWWALISGFTLLFISFIMYSASFDNVKTNKFEWFWYEFDFSPSVLISTG